MEWYPHYIDDFDADTGHLTLAEDGAYRRLLAWYYRNERPLPDDDRMLSYIVRVSPDDWAAIAPKVRAMFQPNGGTTLHHRRCDKVLIQQSRKRKDIRTRVQRLRKRGIVEQE